MKSLMRRSINYLVTSFYHRGIKETCSLLLNHIYFSFIVKSFKTEHIHLERFTISSSNKKHGTPYQTVHYYYFKESTKFIPFNKSQSEIVDFGCGKGFLLLMAAKAGFPNVTGVEFAKELYLECLKNINSYLTREQRTNVKCVLIDAVDYNISESQNVFFFFNPFNEIVFNHVLRNIEKSLKKNIRDIIIIYFNPVYEKLVLEHGYHIIYQHRNTRKTEFTVLGK